MLTIAVSSAFAMLAVAIGLKIVAAGQVTKHA